jgi:hypothetical protein
VCCKIEKTAEVKTAATTRDSSGKPFFANADIENKELPACEIAKRRLSG